jgi:hypothetical protein
MNSAVGAIWDTWKKQPGSFFHFGRSFLVVSSASSGQRMTPEGVILETPKEGYLRCFETSAVISNMLTCFLPPKTTFRTSSALIIRLFF